ncbi:spore germination protein [Neobacillus ginsengisoli]|uniref:Spore germination protein KA n=1 Tax=Neobacillus ginsengisoli TaxID=904295 RepID=A0ABT9Y147_9BACI|nr:spore germination protein [Neobacillus ginsengisoli]MDQ0201535.1 spore germination protein KA [Neobacillus ginsengisoli]
MKRSVLKKQSILHSKNLVQTYLSLSLEQNLALLQDTFDSCDDLVFHSIHFNTIPGCLIYLSEMVNSHALFELDQGFNKYIGSSETESSDAIKSYIRNGFAFSNTNEVNSLETVIDHILSGYTVLLIDKIDHAFLFHSINETGRAVQEPVAEPMVRGPREGFVENIETNLMMIRRKVRNPSLKVNHLRVGKQTNTELSVVYIKGIADEKVVDEVHHRLSRIDIDGVLESHYLESMIADTRWSPFPTVYSTERPDRVCAALLDGKVAILTDGTPFVLTAPAVFVEFLHSNEDYYNGSLIATFTRWIRFLGLFITLILPSFYVAMTTFHQDLLQTPLLLRIAASRENLPYPIVVEAFFMVITFELVREAGLRMPKPFGGAVVTILGLVLISQAAVQAGIIGPVMTVVVSVTALVSFILPNYAFHQVIRFLGLPLLLLAGLFGFMGILVGLMFALAHLVSLRSFGVPYFSPVSPARKEGWKDVFIRAPWWAMETRPPGLNIKNIHRAGPNDSNPSRKNEEVDADDKA